MGSRAPIARLLLLGKRRLRIARLRAYLSASLWFIPALAFSAATALAFSTTTIDRHFVVAVRLPIGFAADAESAAGFLSLISSWMLTFIGLAFTMTIVVLQLASAQFSPRVIGTLLRDRYSQLSLGVFIGTFAYSFMVLRELGADTEQQFVPAVSVAVATALLLVSLGVFIRYVNHVAQSIRAGSVISTVASATRHVVDAEFPDRLPARVHEDWRPYTTIPSPRGGLLRSFDIDGMVGVAEACDVVLEIVPRVGDFVPRGGPLVRVLSDSGNLAESDVLGQISIGQERTMDQDPGFGFRQLVDIAVRALSPGVNDPTTAVQVIDQVHDLLRDLLHREFPSGHHTDAEGRVRLVVAIASWPDFLQLGVEEIRQYGADSVQVARRLRLMLDDLRTAAPPEYHAALDRELRLLQVATSREPVDGDRDAVESE